MHILFAVFISLAFASVSKDILTDGEFTTLVGEHRFSAPTPGFKTLDLSLSEDMCVSRVIVRGTASGPVQLFVHRVAGIRTRDPKSADQYDWLELSSGYTTDFSVPTSIGVLSDEFADCGFLFRITAKHDDDSISFDDITFVSDSEKVSVFQSDDSKKRQSLPSARTTCYTVGTYLDCSNIGGSALSTDGGLCLQVGSQLLCGCATHQDCYTSIQRPFCQDAICQKCKVAISGSVFGGTVPSTIPATTPTFSLVESYRFCRARFPTPYLTSTTSPVTSSNLPSPDRLTGVTQSGVDFFVQFVGVESVGTHLPLPNSQTQGFYKEVCDTQSSTSDGSCKGCNQAYLASGPLNTQYAGITFSAANFPGIPDRTRGRATGGAIGTVFCTTTRPDLPICADPDYWALVGAGNAYTNGVSALRGANLNQPSYINSNWDIAGLYNSVGGEGNDNPIKYYGSCLPCGCTIGGVFTRLHGLCAAMAPRTPICTGTGCAACTDNADCFQLTGCINMGNCTAFDQVGTATQQNCQADGSCKACQSNSDCGVLDGGSTRNQPNCQAGLCTSPVLCSSNAYCIALNPAAPNCNLDGSCISCLNTATSPSQSLSNARCGVTDGPPSPVPASDAQNQQVCSLSGTTIGQCVLCSDNSVCSGLGANCQFDGTCRNCAAAGYPGCSSTDGPPNTSVRQTICNSATGICVPACTSNTDALDASSCSSIYGVSGSASLFLNCMADGTCITCCNTTGQSCSCSTDGPPPGNTPQTQCNSQGLCVQPFRCGINNDCTQPGQSGNCQTTGSCVPCAITRASQSYTSTCELDGGETPGQQNCNLASRLCVGACGVGNVGCSGTQGANCMTNGVCISCTSDEDCSNSQRGNKWGADISGQSKCRLTTGTCYNPYVCTRSQPGSLTANTVDNNNCRTQGTGNNCMNDGTCITCTKNSDCANDGGSVAYQPVCDINSGTCVSCNTNTDCKNAGSIGGNNCGVTGACYNCASSAPFSIPPSSTKVTGQTADSNCCTGGTCQDGGEIKSQPNCDTSTGICVNYCTADYQCAATNGGCTPKCALDRGCCVECNVDGDCPLNNPLIQWRNAELNNNKCILHKCQPGGTAVPTPVAPTPSGNFTGCYTDAQCSGAVGTPACSVTQGRCVACLYDAHCPNLGVCVTNEQRCVSCLYDTHCGPTQYCQTNTRSCQPVSPGAGSVSVASTLVSASFLFASVLIASFF